MTLKIKNPEKDLAIGSWNFIVDERLWRLIRLFITLAFRLPATLVDSLIHTGRGVRGYPVVTFVLVSGLLWWGASKAQNLAGDGLFLLWAVFTIKWIAEWVWAIARRRMGSEEHSAHNGVLLFEMIGIRSSLLALLIVAVLSLLAAGTEQGRIVGPLLLFGCIAAAVIYVMTDARVAREDIARADQQIEAKVRSQRHEARPRRHDNTVEIE
ncbi:MAG: hypothetical protein KF912_02750 [Phycisphaeraceae bacterium]|nr:hypothetical protein [Phycisphaeraceae bacterium]MBX3366219.1 hypothetical protein [Phycisphaeraceae bacterium]